MENTYSELYRQGNSGIFMLTHVSQIINRDESILAYNAHVHSHLMYGALIWGNPILNEICTKQIFVKQKKAVRILIFGYNKVKQSCRGLFKQLSILTFPAIHLFQCFKFIRYNNYLTSGESHQYSTRSEHNIYRNHASNKSIIDNASRVYNKLHNDLKSIRDNRIFCRKVKRWLIDSEFYSVQEFLDFKY